MVSVTAKLAKAKNADYLRLEGCPVSVAEQVLFLVQLGGLKNPYFDMTQALQFNKAYLQWRSATAFQRAIGTPYQKKGPTYRGDAKPQVT